MRFSSTAVRLFLTVAVSAALLSSARGQAANQAEAARETSRVRGPSPFQTGVGPGEQAVVAGELPQRQEYGELKVLYNARPLPTFSLQAFSGAFYTSNAALLPPSREIGDWYFQQGVALNWSKGIFQSTLFPHASFYQSWFEYARPGVTGIGNFSAMDVDVGVTYALRKLANIAVSVDYVYERLADLGLDNEIFHENHLVLGLNKVFFVSRTQSAFVQAFGDISLQTAPLVSERNEYGAGIGYAIDWIPEVTTTFSYRYARYDYTAGPRQDNNHSFAVSLVWRVRPWIFLQLGGNYILNNSNFRIFNYHVFTGGPSAAVNIQW